MLSLHRQNLVVEFVIGLVLLNGLWLNGNVRRLSVSSWVVLSCWSIGGVYVPPWEEGLGR